MSLRFLDEYDNQHCGEYFAEIAYQLMRIADVLEDFNDDREEKKQKEMSK